MNIFNKTFLTISLTLVIPLSIQANWFSNITNAIVGKKKTIAAGVVLGGGLSYLAVKLTDRLHANTKPTDPNSSVHKPLQNNDEVFIRDVLNWAQRNEPLKRNRRFAAILAALSVTARLIYEGHKRNLFGEKS